MWKKDFLFHLKSPKSFFHIKAKRRAEEKLLVSLKACEAFFPH